MYASTLIRNPSSVLTCCGSPTWNRRKSPKSRRAISRSSATASSTLAGRCRPCPRAGEGGRGETRGGRTAHGFHCGHRGPQDLRVDAARDRAQELRVEADSEAAQELRVEADSEVAQNLRVQPARDRAQ